MADDSAALMERLEAWAAKERHNARHVSGPALHPPWGQDIIDRHNQNAADLTLALSLLADRARMEKALREAERELAFAVEHMGRTGGGYERALVSVRQALGASQ